MEMRTKKFLLPAVLLAISSGIYAGDFNTQMVQAEKLFKAGKYKEAAAAYDDASLETEKAAERIKARYLGWESLKKARSGNALKTAESILYDEAELGPAQAVALVSYICSRSYAETAQKAISFVLKRNDLSENQRSRILCLALNNGGTFNSEKYIEEILAMKKPDPAARAVALGHRGNILMWVKKDFIGAVNAFEEALNAKELSRSDRMFFHMAKARAHIGLRQYETAEKNFRRAITIGANQGFLNFAYKELFGLYARTKQTLKAYNLLVEASKDKRLNNSQRLFFADLIKKIDEAKRQKQKQQ